ncbi:MAG: hypothetical protein K2I62_01530 [Alistipes sp.]|nr:hypothetical protein [Alistipes sp.]
MKKMLLTLLFAATAFGCHAQLVQSSSLIVTKQKLPAVKRGYQQSVDAGYNAQLSIGGNDLFGLNYIGGFRFNDTFFLGAGTGLNFKLNNPASEHENGCPMRLNAVNIPLYGHFRAYFLKERITPFFALSLGGRFSTKRTLYLPLGEVKYNTCGLLFNPQVGVNVRTSAKGNVYLAVGFCGQTMPALEDASYSTASVKSKFQYGIDAHIGFTF